MQATAGTGGDVHEPAGEADGPLDKTAYKRLLKPMQLELSAMHNWLRHGGGRLVIVLEGRDAAGKGGVVKTLTKRLNPRSVRAVALPAPSERERSQWYFQRYVAHLPAAGEIVLYDRSWYNRAGVESVMGFADEHEVERFLQQAPVFERMLVDDGILLFKYWLGVDQREQERRFAKRLDDPVKRWKLSPIDIAARQRYGAYTEARERMFAATHTSWAPWTALDFNDKRRGRLNLIRNLLDRLPHGPVPAPEASLPPLPGEPAEESYGAVVRPLTGPF